MPTPDAFPVGAPCWIDLMSPDIDAARSFYPALFGWTAEEQNPEFGGYFMFTKDGHQIAGGMAAMEPSMPGVWTTYLTSDDTAKTLEGAASHGGQVHTPAMPVADLGVMAHVVDPGGAVIGVWQPGLHKGFGVLGEPGTPGWFELHTRDYAPSVDFYRDVFRWDTEVAGDSPEFRYTVAKNGEEQLAGIMENTADITEGSPAFWTVYFAVADTDATLAKVVELGGSVVQAAQDTPYGRLAVAADPTGIPFRLSGPNAA